MQKTEMGKDILQVVNPANGNIIVEYPVSSKEEINTCISNALKAFQLWSHVPAEKRSTILHRVAHELRENSDIFAKIITEEMGKPIRESQSEVKTNCDLLDYFADEGMRLTGDIPLLNLTNEFPFIMKQPIGVVAAITPFNYPLSLLTWKLGPALVTGCTVVAKPDEHAPSVALKLEKIFLKAGLPKDVFQVVLGGAEVGKTLVSHPLVSKIAFTGSVSVGRNIGANALQMGKRVTLELGGQCPAIVMDDANIDTFIKDFAVNAFTNAGQYCYRINRAYVHESIYDTFITIFLNEIKKIKIGFGIDETTTMGPLCNEDIYLNTIRHINDAVSKGGVIRFGGKRLSGHDFDQGYYFMPTVIENADHSMLVMQEETFGPVIGIQKITSLTEGIELANDSMYGLAAFVFTGDAGRGLQAAREIQVGSVWVNKIQRAYYQLPFGGMKQSGQGREKSKYSLDEYVELKAVYLSLPNLD